MALKKFYQMFDKFGFFDHLKYSFSMQLYCRCATIVPYFREKKGEFASIATIRHLKCMKIRIQYDTDKNLDPMKYLTCASQVFHWTYLCETFTIATKSSRNCNKEIKVGALTFDTHCPILIMNKKKKKKSSNSTSQHC